MNVQRRANIVTAHTRVFDDIQIGDSPAPLVKGPLTTLHLFRWSASVENFHRIHYDRDFAKNHDKLPDLLINGSLKQQFLVQLLKDWAGKTGWLWKISFQFRAMNVVGDTMTSWARVTAVEPMLDYGLVSLDLGMTGASGQESTPGKAVVALPYRDGPAVPYPFVKSSPQRR